MRTLTIQLETRLDDDLSQFTNRAKKAIASGQYQGEFLSFATAAAFFSELTNNRWQMLHTLQGTGTIGIRALARTLGRDVRRVHDDAAALVRLGLVEKTETGALCCPYGRIHFDIAMCASEPIGRATAQNLAPSTSAMPA